MYYHNCCLLYVPLCVCMWSSEEYTYLQFSHCCFLDKDVSYNNYPTSNMPRTLLISQFWGFLYEFSDTIRNGCGIQKRGSFIRHEYSMMTYLYKIISPIEFHADKVSILIIFIQTISIAPLQVRFYSEALPTQHGYCAGVSRQSVNFI